MFKIINSFNPISTFTPTTQTCPNNIKNAWVADDIIFEEIKSFTKGKCKGQYGLIESFKMMKMVTTKSKGICIQGPFTLLKLNSYLA